MHKVAWINLVFLMNQYYIIIENNLSVESLISTLTDIKGQLKNMTVDYKALKEDLQGWIYTTENLMICVSIIYNI